MKELGVLTTHFYVSDSTSFPPIETLKVEQFLYMVFNYYPEIGFMSVERSIFLKLIQEQDNIIAFTN